MKWIIWLFVVLVLIGGGLVGFFWYQAYTAQGLEFKLEGPDHAQVGVPFEIKIEIENNSGNILQEAELAIELPEGMVFLGSSAGKGLVRKVLGNLGEGSLTKDTFQAMVLSGESSLKQVQGAVSYLPVSLGTRFEQNETEELRVSDSGVFIDLEAPAKVFSGEEFEIVIDYENNAEIEFADFQINLVYPSGFRYVSSTLEPVNQDSLFEIGNLQPESKNSFTITGRLEGPDNAFFDIDAIA
ncbi:MAG: hypothetical protein OXT67_12310, partial [Zetaproteobacteria bacterium]|nr:hypothetical protein [Zetaproteobacteria bacterium]